MNIVVQKFGGTSLASPALRARAVERIVSAKRAGMAPVVVVSAMGRRGDPYATDTLLSLFDAGGPPPRARERDQLAACGETIAAALLAHLVWKAGCPAVSLTGGQAGIVTDDRFGSARIIEVRLERLRQLIKEGWIPVVAGFQGVTARGDVTTLGRGGSDTTAAALAGGLKAAAMEIYTDVAGIMSADPRIEPEAHLLPRLTYQEVAEMAYMGAKVIHPRAVEIARHARVPVRVLGMAADSAGTLIADDIGWEPDGGRSERIVAGIAHVKGLVQVQVETNREGKDPREGKAAVLPLLRRLADEDVSLDMIFLSPLLLLFVVAEDDRPLTETALKELPIPYRIRDRLAKVSVVGAGMHGVPGVMADVLAALRQIGVAVYQTADSHTTISCLVAEADVEKTVRALHRAFGLGRAARRPVEEAEVAAGANGFTGEAGDAT